MTEDAFDNFGEANGTFDQILKLARERFHIRTFADVEEYLILEVDGCINMTNSIRVLNCCDGTPVNATTVLIAEFMNMKQLLRGHEFELVLDLLCANLNPGHVRVSDTNFFQECLVYKFLHINKNSINRFGMFGVILGVGADYEKHVVTRSRPMPLKLAENPLFANLAQFLPSKNELLLDTSTARINIEELFCDPQD